VVANVSTVTGRKVHEQVKYCYKLPVTAFCMSFFFLKSTWDKLPDKAKAAFWEAGKWYDTNGAPAVNKNVYPQSIWPMVTKAGVKAVTPTAEELKLFEERSQPVWAWWKKQVGEEIGQKAINLATERRSRPLKNVHLLRWRARALAAAYLEYAWAHLRWVPHLARAALHLDLFERPDTRRVVQQPARRAGERIWDSSRG